MTTLTKLAVFILFLIYFLLIFKQYPDNNSLPGNTDTIYNLSIFKDYGNSISAFFTNEQIGNALYPEKSVQQYAELYLGEALIFNVLDLISSRDLYTYYLFISILYALNGWAAYLLSFYLFKHHLPAVVVGFMLSSSSFAFSQIELLNGIPYAPFCISLLFFLKYLKNLQLRYLLLSSVFAAFQFYFSNYIFLYLIIFFIVVIFAKKWTILLKSKTYLHLLLASFIGLLLLLPYGIMADWGTPVQKAFNPINLEMIKKFSLGLNDFGRHLPNHRLYNLPQAKILNETMRNVNFAFVGFVSYFFLLLALFKKGYHVNKHIYIYLILIGILMAVGPFLNINGVYYKMPLYPIYKYFNLQNYLRIPPRALSLAILGVALLIGMYLSSLDKRKRNVISLMFMFVFFLENVPKHFHQNNGDELLLPPSNLYIIADSLPLDQTNIAFFPSSILSDKVYNDYGVSEYSREYIYSYWQTKIKVNTINGLSGFFPASRLYNNDLMMNIEHDNNLERLIILNALDYIVVVKDKTLILSQQELTQIDFIYNSPFLSLISESENATLFKINQ